MAKKNHIDGSFYGGHFRSQQSLLPNSEIAWFDELRERALAKYEQTGIPGPKVEEWKYTNLSALKSGAYITSTVNDHPQGKLLEEATLDGVAGAKVVFVDGYLCKSLTRIDIVDGLTLSGINEFIKSEPTAAQALFAQNEDQSSLRNLNIALMTDGYVINVAENVKLAEPIHIIHLASHGEQSKALRTRNFINVGRGASAKVVESFYGELNGNCWRQNISSITLDSGAKLEIYQLQMEGRETIHMAESGVTLGEDADFKHYSLNIGGKMSRTEIKPTLSGLHANVDLRGAFLGRDGGAHDVFTHMQHMVPECTSDQNYRGVLDRGGKSAFQGKVYVAKDAQLTNADQSNKNLILDRSAEANSKPELLIYADDVKCSHGATVGELDQEALFYLKSRGLDQHSAKALLVEAFVAEVFEDVSLAAVKDKYLALARAWLDTGE